MNEKPHLTLEVLSGPLDGQTITIQSDSDWTRLPGSPLSFPWDDELGEPQARFILFEEGWQLSASEAPHGTYRVDQSERLTEGDTISLENGNLLKASGTWLKIQNLLP